MPKSWAQRRHDLPKSSGPDGCLAILTAADFRCWRMVTAPDTLRRRPCVSH
jgi:hypothetical protein